MRSPYGGSRAQRGAGTDLSARASIVRESVEARGALWVTRSPSHARVLTAWLGEPGAPSSRGVRTVDELLAGICRPTGAGFRHVSSVCAARILDEVCRAASGPPGPLSGASRTRGFASGVMAVLDELRGTGVASSDVAHAIQATTEDECDPTARALAEKTMALVDLWERYEALLRSARLGDGRDLARAAISVLGRTRTTGAYVLDAVDPHDAELQRIADALALSGSYVLILYASTEAHFAREGGSTLGRGLMCAMVGEHGGHQAASLVEDDGRTGVVVLDAPNRHAECEMVAAEISRYQRLTGCSWSDCRVWARSLGQYGPILAGVCERWNVPLAVERSLSVAEAPVVRSVLGMLRVFAHGWRRSDLLSALKCPGLGIDRVALDSLRALAEGRGVRCGRSEWMGLAASLSISKTLAVLAAWDEEFMADPLPVPTFAAKLGNMLEGVGVTRAAAPDDRTALTTLLRGVESASLAATVAHREAVSAVEFLDIVEHAAETSPYQAAEIPDTVRLADVAESDGVSSSLAVVMGLTERSFPRRAGEDPFLRDDERDRLRVALGIDLAKSADRYARERLLFCQSVSTAENRIVVTWPRTEEDRDSAPSHFLLDLRRVAPRLSVLSMSLADDLPPVHGAQSDWAIPALAARDIAAVERPTVPSLWSNRARSAYTASRHVSVSELETYEECPFRHFATTACGLVDLPSARTLQGVVTHAALRDGLRSASGPACESEAGLTEKLSECAMRELAGTVLDAGSHRRRMLMQSLHRYALDFAAREVRYRALWRERPVYLELAFGRGGAENDGSRGDPRSTSEPLCVGIEESEPARVSGVVDRVDIDPHGGCATIIDYKVGSAPSFSDMRDGKSLQMPLYMLALEQLWGLAVAVACYDTARDEARRRLVRTDLAQLRTYGPIPGVERGDAVKPISGSQFREMLDTACQVVAECVVGIRQGKIVPVPGAHCGSCSVGDLCRTLPSGHHDGAPLPASGRDDTVPGRSVGRG